MAPLATCKRTWLTANYPEQSLSVVDLGDLSPRPPGIFLFFSAPAEGVGPGGLPGEDRPALLLFACSSRRSGCVPAEPLKQRRARFGELLETLEASCCFGKHAEP